MTDSEKLDLLLKDVSGLKEDVSGLKEDVSGLKEDVSGLKEDTGSLKKDVEELKDGMNRIEKRVTSIELTLENETNKNIKRIAEGHLDLARNLKEAQKYDDEREMLDIRLTIQENEMRKLKENLPTIA